ncbi:MAG: homocysteine S-methyltransferase family protein [Planctomycetota bacterium]
MPLYRNELPQLSGSLFLTDGGLETTLIFHEGIDLLAFAAFVLLENEDGCETLRKYYRRYANIARDYNVGFILESMTWRASQDWGKKLGYSSEQITDFNRKGIELLQGIRREYEGAIPHLVMSGCIGPRGDGYNADISMTASEAEAYHRTQIATFRETEADMVAAFTIPYIAEGIGIALAARSEEMPVVISFTVETDGRLPSGEMLKDAIEKVDTATNNAPAYYMINCAHPTHFVDVLELDLWTQRIRAIRANASTKSHAELNEATELDEGNPQELGSQYLDLVGRLENLNILGGCCGTDHRHVTEMCNVFVELEKTRR